MQLHSLCAVGQSASYDRRTTRSIDPHQASAANAHRTQIDALATAMLADGRIVNAKHIRRILGRRTMRARTWCSLVAALEHLQGAAGSASICPLATFEISHPCLTAVPAHRSHIGSTCRAAP